MFTLNVNVILLYRAYLITFSFSQMAIDKFNSEDGSILQNTPTLTRGPYVEDGLIPSMDICEEEYFYTISYLSFFQISKKLNI